MTKSFVANKAGYERVTYYAHIKQKDLDLDIVEKYAKALGHDFSDEIPAMKEHLLSGPEATYLGTPTTITEAIKQRDYYLRLYWEKLEEIRKLEEELKRLKEKA